MNYGNKYDESIMAEPYASYRVVNTEFNFWSHWRKYRNRFVLRSNFLNDFILWIQCYIEVFRFQEECIKPNKESDRQTDRLTQTADGASFFLKRLIYCLINVCVGLSVCVCVCLNICLSLYIYIYIYIYIYLHMYTPTSFRG